MADDERDLGRWLDAVRPPTAADDGWADSAAADDVLAAVHDRAARRTARSRRTRRAALWAPAPLLAAAAAALVFAGGPAPLPPPRAGGPAPFAGARPAALLLHEFDSCSQALDGLRAHAAQHPNLAFGAAFNRYYGGMLTNGVSFKGAPLSAAATAPGGSALQASPTNVQEAGVDEPDVVKTDGDTVVTLTDGVLRVLAASPPRIVRTVDLSMYAGSSDAQLLVGQGKALVVLHDDHSIYAYDERPMPATRTTLVFVDLAAGDVVGTMRLSGAYVDARQVGDTVRLVARSSPTLSVVDPDGSPSTAQERAAIEAAPVSAWLPSYTLTVGHHTTRGAVPCTLLSRPAHYTGASLLTVYTLDFGDLGADPRPVAVAGDGDTVYATHDSLYVATNPEWFFGSANDQQTELHRFDIAGAGRPTYLGSAEVEGRLLNSYSLSDYAGHLRIATTNGYRSTGDNSVTVLDSDTLKQTGRVDGLGRGERIYAVRFLGALGYVVTYRETDPLYTLDLSDPARPRVASALKLSGYSAYLHDAGDGRLIGVGQATDDGRVQGLQVSLFDVRHPADPSRLARVELPGTAGEGQVDPHTFLYDEPTGLVVAPVSSWSGAHSGEVLALRLDGTTLRRLGTVANPVQPGTVDDGLGIQHSMLVDGQLWTISGSGVQVTDPDTLRPLGWTPFPAP